MLSFKREKWLKFNHVEATIMEALEKLNDLVDESDPDLDVPNIVHAFQSAEQVRRDHPDKEWFQLTALIHDLGKVNRLRIVYRFMGGMLMSAILGSI